jgi:HlyD family secretion protein
MLLIFAAIVLPWSILAKVDETASGRGRIEPKSKTVQLDAPVAGTVDAVRVREGDRVKKGQVLVKLESEVMRSGLQELEKKRTGQRNQLMQLELLQNQLRQELRTQQQQNQAQQAEKLAQLEQAQQDILSKNADYRSARIDLEGAKEKVARYQEVFDEGIIPKERLLEAQQTAQKNAQVLLQTRSEILRAKSRLQEQQRSYQGLINSSQLAVLKIEQQLKDIKRQSTSLQTETAQNESQIKSINFQLNQRTLKSSVDGTIFQIPKGNSSVVQPGTLLVEIAPKNSPLILRSNIATKDSGSIKVGMPVKLKFDAYPFQDYGVVQGRVSWISPNSKKEENSQGQLETFELEIELERTYIDAPNKRIALTPGQTATAELIVRQRRLIDFMLDPFKKLQKGGLDL